LPVFIEGLIESTKSEKFLYSVKAGDAFFTRTSETIEEIGFASVCETTIDQATFAGFLIRFRPTTNELNMKYAKYYFRSDMLRTFFVKEMMIVTRASLQQSLLKNLFVLLPPYAEQQKIADYLEKKCAKIDKLISEKQESIRTMQDYKKSLIYEYTTGKKRVKGFAS
jgi:type I restriction enzyme S subunit